MQHVLQATEHRQPRSPFSKIQSHVQKHSPVTNYSDFHEVYHKSLFSGCKIEKTNVMGLHAFNEYNTLL